MSSNDIGELVEAWKDATEAYRDLVLVIDELEGIHPSAESAATKAIKARSYAIKVEKEFYDG